MGGEKKLYGAEGRYPDECIAVEYRGRAHVARPSLALHWTVAGDSFYEDRITIEDDDGHFAECGLSARDLVPLTSAAEEFLMHVSIAELGDAPAFLYGGRVYEGRPALLSPGDIDHVDVALIEDDGHIAFFVSISDPRLVALTDAAREVLSVIGGE
jgi:hypothetical protein